MTDFNKILDKAKELEAKMKESQQKIKELRVEGISGSNSAKIVLDGDCLLYTSPSPRDLSTSRMPSSA